jgi:high-affinity K+ transport system ATPase subunit B
MSQQSKGNSSDSVDSEKVWEIVKKILSVTWQVIVWSFMIALWLLGFTIFFIRMIGAIAEGRPLPEYRPPQRRKQRFDVDQFRQEFQDSKVKDVLKGFEEELKQLEQLDRQGKLEPEQQKVVRKLRSFDRSKYDSRLQDVFDEEELEELLLLILILLGVEVA